MNKKKVSIFTFSSVLLCGLIPAVAVGFNDTENGIGSIFNSIKVTHIHNGNHYLRRNSTSTESGVKEYWVCCGCHEHYLEEPSDGIWEDLGISHEVFDLSDDRYIRPTGDIKDIEVTNYTTSLVYGHNYNFDGKVTLVYNDDSKEETKDYEIDYTDLNRYQVGLSTFRVCVGSKFIDCDVTVNKSNSLKVLFIGNSFSQDTRAYSKSIAESMGIEIDARNLYIGGCSLETHWNNITNDNGAYQYEMFGGTSVPNYKISQALKDADWDFVSIQQASVGSGRPSTYGTYVEDIRDYIKSNCKNPEVNVVFNMTWAYREGGSQIDWYNNDQMTMYNAIVDTMQSKVLGNVDHIIPNGTAIQNYRSSYYADNLCRDEYSHLQLYYGRYTAGLTMVSALTGHTPDEATWKGTNMTKDEYEIAVESATNAITTPFAITQSKYKEPETFVELSGVSYTDGYYYNVNEGANIKPWPSARFSATQLFSKDQLPEGSYITIASGYQIRPERFITAEKTTDSSKRLGNVTTKYVLPEGLYDQYNFIGFNVSKTDGTDIEDYEEAHNAIKFYVSSRTYKPLENINYLSVLDVFTWPSTNPEILVSGFGQPDENYFSPQSLQFSNVAWAEASAGTSSTCEYAFSYPYNGSISSVYQSLTMDKAKVRNFLFRLGGDKPEGMTISIKKGVTFTNNGKLYAFDRDYTLNYVNKVWYVDDITVLALRKVSTWSSGNPEFTFAYEDGAFRNTLRSAHTTAPEFEVTGSTVQNVEYAWSDPLDKVYTSQSTLLRVKDPTTDGVSIFLDSSKVFTINGARYKFKADYTVVKESGSWKVDLPADSVLNVSSCGTWDTKNVEICLKYDDSKFEMDCGSVGITYNVLPNWFDVENCVFASYCLGFPSPLGGQKPSQCILFRVTNRVAGSKIHIHKNKKFTVTGYIYEFEKDVTLTFDGQYWSITE